MLDSPEEFNVNTLKKCFILKSKYSDAIQTNVHNSNGTQIPISLLTTPCNNIRLGSLQDWGTSHIWTVYGSNQDIYLWYDDNSEIQRPCQMSISEDAFWGGKSQ